MINLIKASNQVYTVNSKKEIINLTETQGITLTPTRENFEEYGLESFDNLAVPQHTAIKDMHKGVRIGEGKLFSVKVNPSNYRNDVQKMEVKKEEV